jgi:tRNA(His) guanylyltransferase
MPHPPRTHPAGRRSAKIVSVVTSYFAANYVRWWGDAMGPARPLRATPAFDGRAVCYPSARALRDYLAWRQADCHINNQVCALGAAGRRRPASVGQHN